MKINSKELEDFKKNLESKEKESSYIKNKSYWEIETPKVIRSENAIIYHYKKHGALQLKIFVTNSKGETSASHINLRRYKLQEQPEVLATLVDVLSSWQQELKEKEIQDEAK